MAVDFTGIQYNTFDAKTRGVFLFKNGAGWSDEMKTTTSTYDYCARAIYFILAMRDARCEMRAAP